VFAIKTNRFVRKIFSVQDESIDGLKEWFNLLLINDTHHAHLMTALCAYEQEERFSIVFEEATMSLADYFKSDGRTLTPEELWNQVEGITDGLAHLHEGISGRTIYHTDLKPANILIVNKIMKIADFGLLEYKPVRPTGDWGSSGVSSGLAYRPYAAPANQEGTFTRSMDVWSLGAIISEIATFDIQKKQGIEEYRANRSDEVEEGVNVRLSNFHLNGILKQSVRDRHAQLLEHINRSESSEYRESVTPFQHAFFNLALFHLIEKMLSVGAECPTAKAVVRDLKTFYRHALQANVFRVPAIRDIWEEIEADSYPNMPENPKCRLQVNLSPTSLQCQTS
jgi:serine/threonine protein kinase